MKFVSKRKLMEENEGLRCELEAARERISELLTVNRELDKIKEQRDRLERDVWYHKESIEKLNIANGEFRGRFEEERGALLDRIANAQDARCEILEKYTALLITLKEITEEKFNEAVSDADQKEDNV